MTEVMMQNSEWLRQKWFETDDYDGIDQVQCLHEDNVFIFALILP